MGRARPWRFWEKKGEKEKEKRTGVHDRVSNNLLVYGYQLQTGGQQGKKKGKEKNGDPGN